MRGSTLGRRRRRYRRTLRSDRRAVVSVVGTLLSLLVFFALFGVFLTRYVPLWMSENEETLTTQIQTALANFKSGVDGQITSGAPAVVGTPLPMASDSIPLIAQPTAATLRYTPPGTAGGPYASFSMSPAPGSTSTATVFPENFTVGNLFVNVPSRYYSPTFFSVENDAVIQSQSAQQQIVEFPPTLSVSPLGSGYGLTATLVILTGVSTQATGTGTQEIFTHYKFAQAFTSTSASGSAKAVLTEGTLYPCAWKNFVSSTIVPTGVSIVFNSPSTTCANAFTSPFPFSVTISGLSSITLVLAEVQVVIGIGTE